MARWKVLSASSLVTWVQVTGTSVSSQKKWSKAPTYYPLLDPVRWSVMHWDWLLPFILFSLFVYQAETNLIYAGRPAPGKELTNEYNVLEAGLWNAISLNKGASFPSIKYTHS